MNSTAFHVLGSVFKVNAQPAGSRSGFANVNALSERLTSCVLFLFLWQCSYG